MANQVPVVPDVQQLQDALAVPPAQAGAAQNQAQDAQNVDGGEQPAAVAAPVAVPAAQPVDVPDADVVKLFLPVVGPLAFLLLSVASVFRRTSQHSVPLSRMCLL